MKEIQNWSSQIDQTSESFNHVFGKLSQDQLNWKPNLQSWSIAQNIDHIITINESYFPIIKAVHEGNYNLPFIAKIGFLVNFFGKALLSSAQPDRRRKSKTFAIWEPSGGELQAGILERFNRHQEKLKVMISESDDLLGKNTIISSPANKNIVYKLETAFDVLVAHEKRHFEQAKEVLKNMKLEADQ